MRIRRYGRLAKRLTDDAQFDCLYEYYLHKQIAGQKPPPRNLAVNVRAQLAKDDFEAICTKLFRKFGVHPVSPVFLAAPCPHHIPCLGASCLCALTMCLPCHLGRSLFASFHVAVSSMSRQCLICACCAIGRSLRCTASAAQHSHRSRLSPRWAATKPWPSSYTQATQRVSMRNAARRPRRGWLSAGRMTRAVAERWQSAQRRWPGPPQPGLRGRLRAVGKRSRRLGRWSPRPRSRSSHGRCCGRSQPRVQTWMSMQPALPQRSVRGKGRFNSGGGRTRSERR